MGQSESEDYDPAVGAYLEVDPLGLEAGFNPYAYAASNPVNDIDPTGLDCSTIAGRELCTAGPGGPSFNLPAPNGFPNQINASNPLYHIYEVNVPIGCDNPGAVQKQLAQQPTPGSSNPASPSGTRNTAKPFGIFSNDVMSYTTSSTNGGVPLVVNMSIPGQFLNPGYVAQWVSGGYVHVVGDGLDLPQSPLPLNSVAPGAGDSYQQELANMVWGQQVGDIVKKLKCTCKK